MYNISLTIAGDIMPDLKIRKIGNSLGVIFPNEMIKERKLKENETVFVSVAKKADLRDMFGSLKIKESGQKIKDDMRKGWD